MEGGTRSYEIARRLVARGHEVHMITSDRDPGGTSGGYQTDEDGITVHWLPVFYSNTLSNTSRIHAFLVFARRSLRKALHVPGDLVFATSTPLTIALPAVWAARRRNIPMVFEVRDLWPELPIAIGALTNPLAIRGARWLERFAYRNSEHVVVLSPGMKNGVLKMGYPADRVSIIPNSCDLKLFSAPADLGIELRSRYSWLGNRPLVVYAGTLGLINGVDYLVHVAAKVKSMDSEIRFLVVGSGKMTRDVRRVATSARVLDQNFFMWEGVSKDKMPAILSAATVATSLFVDLEPMWINSANKFFDGLAAGKPVVINYRGWQADLLEDNGAGLVLPANDHQAAALSLVRHIRNPNWLHKSGDAAAKLARECFDRDQLAQKLEHVLLRVEADWLAGQKFR